jgi:hypothetical protein
VAQGLLCYLANTRLAATDQQRVAEPTDARDELPAGLSGAASGFWFAQKGGVVTDDL